MRKIGTIVRFNSKEGGGSYCIIAHANCSECKAEIEVREQIEPSKTHRSKGRYYLQSQWCPECGHWEGKNLIII